MKIQVVIMLALSVILSACSSTPEQRIAKKFSNKERSGMFSFLSPAKKTNSYMGYRLPTLEEVNISPEQQLVYVLNNREKTADNQLMELLAQRKGYYGQKLNYVPIVGKHHKYRQHSIESDGYEFRYTGITGPVSAPK